MQHYKKSLLKVIFFLSILFLQVNFASALNVCPGEPATLSWSTQGIVTACPTTDASSPQCIFSANPANNYSGERSVSLPSGSCTVSFQCQNGVSVSQVAGDTLTVVNSVACCGRFSQSAQTVWNGTTCVNPPCANGAVDASCTTCPATGPTFQKWGQTPISRIVLEK
jgi:hypothetical protein